MQAALTTGTLTVTVAIVLTVASGAVGGLMDLNPRVEALKRVLMFINLFTLGAVITGFIQMFNLFIWVPADILLQFFAGYSLPEVALFKRNYRWHVNAWAYAMWGDGRANWLPFV